MQKLQMELEIPHIEAVDEVMAEQNEHEKEQVQQTLTGEEISTLPKVRTTDGHLM